MATFVLVRANRVVKTINGSRELRTNEKLSDGRRYRVQRGVPVYIGGTVTLSGNVVTAISNPQTISTAQQRRETLLPRLRSLADIPVATWGLMNNNASTRATNYWWRLEMLGAAISVDGNLTDDAKARLIVSELEKNPADWFDDHTVAAWRSVRDTDTYYTTATNGGKTEQTSVAMPASYDGLVKQLYGA